MKYCIGKQFLGKRIWQVRKWLHKRAQRLLRTFALIVCAQRYCAGNATVICHALLRALVKSGFKTFAKTVDDKSCTALDQRRAWSVKIDLKYLWKSSRLLHDWYSRDFISRALVYLTFIQIFQASVKIPWRQKRRGKNSRPAKEWHIYFRIIMKLQREVSGRMERSGKGSWSSRLVAESLENSRTNRCVNLMGLFLFNVFITLRT